ncbi:unnamed protein product [Gulo gulo]|uniref:Uncharacterized protein n=1 Tax=Gulo gulo TaxID=48420 RepID=A0A9X9Q9V6_GULGU|nr:unnamed protein product [Gulo gulo]
MSCCIFPRSNELMIQGIFPVSCMNSKVRRCSKCFTSTCPFSNQIDPKSFRQACQQA